MALDATDWTATRSTKVIDYIGDAHAGASPTYATGIELHDYTRSRADDLSSTGDDQIAIIDDTPTDRVGVDTIIEMKNGWTLTATALEHIYDCSIIQADGDDIYDGIVNFGDASSIQILQNGARLTNDFWNEANQIAATSDASRGISHRFLVQVRSSGTDIDGRRLYGTQRVLGTEYNEFFVNGTERGNNVLALTATADLNNTTAAGTIATWTDIVNNNEGYIANDVNDDSTDEFYYSEWDLGSRTKNQFYERGKWLFREGTAETLYGLAGDLFRGITHEITIDTPTGTFVEPESVSWPNGTGQLLAIDSTTAGTKMWIQLLTGIAPVDNELITGNGGATCLVNVTVTSRPITDICFLGKSTGSAIIGAYGLGIEFADLAAADTITSLDNLPLTPPNLQSWSISGLVVGEDTVFVANNDGGAPELDQFSLATTLSGAAETALVITGSIPGDTPATGTVLVFTDGNDVVSLAYTSWSGSTFVIPSTNFSGDNATSGNDAFLGYIFKVATATTESFSAIHTGADRTMFYRVRDGGGTPIETIEGTQAFTATGGAVTINRQSDAS